MAWRCLKFGIKVPLNECVPWQGCSDIEVYHCSHVFQWMAWSGTMACRWSYIEDVHDHVCVAAHHKRHRTPTLKLAVTHGLWNDKHSHGRRRVIFYEVMCSFMFPVYIQADGFIPMTWYLLIMVLIGVFEECISYSGEWNFWLTIKWTAE